MPPIYIDVGNGLWHCFTRIIVIVMNSIWLLYFSI